MKKRDKISIIVLVACIAMWFGGLAVAEGWIERKVHRTTGGKWELNIGNIRLNPFVPVVTFNNITAHQVDSGKLTTAEQLRIERPRMGKKRGIRARRILLNRRDTIEGITLGQGRLAVARVSLFNEDESMHFTADSLVADTVARRISMKTFAAEPTYTKEEFTEKSWNNGDWTQIRIGAVECSGVDIKGMAIDSIHIAGGSIESFKNRNIMLNTAPKPMYHSLLQKLYARAAIRSIVFTGISARYEELPLRGDQAGVFNVDGVSGTASASGTAFNWAATGQIMGSAPLTAHGTIPLKGDDFELSGSLGECPLDIFNPMATPLGRVEIRTGTLRQLDFTLAGDSINAHAEVLLRYSGLSIELIDRHHEERKLLSEIANDLLPHASAEPHPTTGEFARDPQRSVWSYVWKTLFEAIKKTAISTK